MIESNDIKYNYYTSKYEDNCTNSLSPKELDTSVNYDRISKTTNTVLSKLGSKQNIRLRNKYSKR